MTTSTTVLKDRDSVLAALSPLRREMLRLLRTPGSASSLARDLDLPRQKLNYHLRELERHGLVRLVDEKPRRGLVERFFESAADRMLVDPELLGPTSADPDVGDKYAAEQLALTAARAVHDIGELIQAASESGQRLATFTLDGDLTFATPQDLRKFVAELGALIARYDQPNAAGGRRHRFIAMSHPSPTTHQEEEE